MEYSVLELRILESGWISGEADDADDPFAHGTVMLAVDGHALVTPADGSFTLSAAGLYLLRTLQHDHALVDTVSDGNALFPCCGYIALPSSGVFPVFCIGCPGGRDVTVTHQGDEVLLDAGDGPRRVFLLEWRKAVLAFVGAVEDFYARCSPKHPATDPEEARGWALFWAEWQQRRQAAQAL